MARYLNASIQDQSPYTTHTIKAMAYRQNGKKQGNRESLNLAIQHFTQALDSQRDSASFEGRAACHVYLGQYEKAVQDYDEVIRLDSGNFGAILSKMEVEICLGRYAQARETYGDLNPETLPVEYQMTAAWLMGLALALDGLDFHEYAAILQNRSISLNAHSYDASDIEPYLDSLEEKGLPKDRIQNARAIHQAFRNLFS